MIWRWDSTICQDVKGNTHVIHLLLNHIMQKDSMSGLINGISFLNSLGDLNPVLVSVLVVWNTSALNQ
jgi:hypothetical protein